MSPLEQLFRCEVEFHRQMREAAEPHAAAAAHTSFALKNGYERLLGAASRATAREVEAVATKYQLLGDARDVLQARDSVRALLGVRQFEG